MKPFFTSHLWYKAMLKVWKKSWEPFRIYQLTSTANSAIICGISDLSDGLGGVCNHTLTVQLLKNTTSLSFFIGVIFCWVPFVSKVNENWKRQLNSYSKSIFRSLSWFQWVFVKPHNPVLAYFYIQAIVQAHWVGNQLNYSTKWRIEGWPMACATLHRDEIHQFFVRWL